MLAFGALTAVTVSAGIACSLGSILDHAEEQIKTEKILTLLQLK